MVLLLTFGKIIKLLYLTFPWHLSFLCFNFFNNSLPFLWKSLNNFEDLYRADKNFVCCLTTVVTGGHDSVVHNLVFSHLVVGKPISLAYKHIWGMVYGKCGNLHLCFNCFDTKFYCYSGLSGPKLATVDCFTLVCTLSVMHSLTLFLDCIESSQD